MGKQQPLGCGRFSEDAWADLVVGEERPQHSPLLTHLQSCPACRAEMADYERLTLQVRHAAAPDEQFRTAFVDGVIADLERQQSGTRRPTGAQSRPGWLTRMGRYRSGSSRRAAGSRAWAPGSPAWAAAAFALFILVMATGLPWSLLPGGFMHRSTGEALPGGTIFVANNVADDARTVGLTTFATVSAAGGTSDGTGDDGRTRTTANRDAELAIRVSRGIVSAAAGFASPAEGGFSVQ